MPFVFLQSWQNAAVKVALDLRLFDALISSSGHDVSTNELAQITGGDEILLGLPFSP